MWLATLTTAFQILITPVIDNRNLICEVLLLFMQFCHIVEQLLPYKMTLF